MTRIIGLSIFRFALCLAATICLWLVSVLFRTWAERPIDYATFAITATAFLITTLRFYRAGATSTVITYACCIILVYAADHLWDRYGYFDQYKNIKNYTPYITLIAVTVAAASFLHRSVSASSHHVMLPVAWLGLIAIMFAIGTHLFIPGYGMVGSRYIVIVFLSLVVAELVRIQRLYASRDDHSATTGESA